MNILEFIPFGAENAVSRKFLANLYGGGERGDRRARKAIERARESQVIINLQDGTGYYRPNETDGAAVERQIKQITSRAKKINQQKQAIEKWQQEHSGQQSLEV